MPHASSALMLLLPLVLVACAEVGGTPEAAPELAEPVFEAARPHIRAVTLDARRRPSPETLPRLRDLGVTHLTLTSFGFQPRYDTPEIRLHNEADWFSESDTGIRALAEEADSLGMHLILKPHIWIGHYSSAGQDRHRVAFETEAGWQAWEEQYRDFVLHYAHLAEDVDASILVVGTELANAVRTRPAFWHTLIAEVRQVYGGRLTYAANWWEEYEHVSFWDALDYVGVQAYFPLSDTENPTPEALNKGWAPHRAALAKIAQAAQRPLLFTEIGYRSVGYAATEPWRWPSRDETTAPDPALQAALYQAFFEEVWDAPWFAGAIVWKWYPENDTRRHRRRHDLDFTPQNKPAEAIIGEWFRKKSPVAN